MEIVIAILSWIVTILGPLLVLSVPVDFIVARAKKEWRDSKEQGIYRKVQLVCLGVVAVCLAIVIVLMNIPL